MRAWLLFLAVLATFEKLVQVASTEDISSKFITAISRDHHVEEHERLTTVTPPIVRVASLSPHYLEESLISDTNSISNTRETTALSRSFRFPLAEYNSSVTSLKSEVLLDLSYERYSGNMKNGKGSVPENIIIEIRRFADYEVHPDQVVMPKNQNSKNKSFQDEYLTQMKDHLEIFEKNTIPNGNEAQKNELSKHQKINEISAVKTPQLDNITKRVLEKQQSPTINPQPLLLSSQSTSSTHYLHEQEAKSKVSNCGYNQNEQIHDWEHEFATYSNHETIAEKVKPDPSTLVEIENSLLSLFNMKRPPKVDRSEIVIPEAMKQLYVQIMGHELDSVNIPRPGLLTKSANTVRSFTHQESKIDDRFPHHHRFRLYFDIGGIPIEEKLKAAELQLSRDDINHEIVHPLLANRTRYQILVYDITRVGVRGKREPNYFLLDTKTVRLNSTETVSLDVQPAVDRWLATPKKNFGLLVEVRTMCSLKPAPHHHVRLRRSAGELHDNNWQHKQPLLFTYTDDGRHKSRSIRDVSARSKRAGHRRPHRRKNTEENCRRHSLYVDFADVGWSDWIVAPPGYDAFYCHGKCPFPLAEHLNSTNHAVVQTLVNNINPGKVPKACCVPTQLEGIAMLYLNDQRTVVLKNYQDMTVVGCGCR